jgi:hypothetical protein
MSSRKQKHKKQANPKDLTTPHRKKKSQSPTSNPFVSLSKKGRSEKSKKVARDFNREHEQDEMSKQEFIEKQFFDSDEGELQIQDKPEEKEKYPVNELAGRNPFEDEPNIEVNQPVVQHQVYAETEIRQALEATGLSGGTLDWFVNHEMLKQKHGALKEFEMHNLRTTIVQGEKDLRNLELEENLNQLTSWAGEWNTDYVHSNVFPKQHYQETYVSKYDERENIKPTVLNKQDFIWKGDVKLRTWQHLDSKFPRYDDFVDPVMSTIPSNHFFLF